MRQFKNHFKREGLIALLLMLLISSTLFAAGTATIYNKGVSVREAKTGGTWVEYYGTTATVVANDDSIGTHYTKAMYLWEFNEADAYFRMVMSNSARGTEDCNVSIEYSDDRTTWTAGSLASGVIKDQLTTTAVVDTLNKVAKVEDPMFKTYRWFRLKFVFQAGNPYLTTLTWSIVLRKPDTIRGQYAQTANKL